jgi:hypothetical protein
VYEYCSSGNEDIGFADAYAVVTFSQECVEPTAGHVVEGYMGDSTFDVTPDGVDDTIQVFFIEAQHHFAAASYFTGLERVASNFGTQAYIPSGGVALLPTAEAIVLWGYVGWCTAEHATSADDCAQHAGSRHNVAFACMQSYDATGSYCSGTGSNPEVGGQPWSEAPAAAIDSVRTISWFVPFVGHLCQIVPYGLKGVRLNAYWTFSNTIPGYPANTELPGAWSLFFSGSSMTMGSTLINLRVESAANSTSDSASYLTAGC